MSASVLIPGGTADNNVRGGVFVSAPAAGDASFFARGEFPYSQQSLPVFSRTATSGSWYEEMAGTGAAGVIEHIDWVLASTWRAGRPYDQFAIAVSPATGLSYVKSTAGQLVSNTDPSADIAPPGNWVLLTNTAGPALGSGNSLVAQAVGLDGSQSAQIQWLGDRFGGVAAQLSGRPANGTIASDARLRVSGLVSCEGFQISNVNHLADPSIGGGTLGAGGNLVVNTGASDVNARIFITPTSAGAGSLYVINKLAASFEVVSSAGGADAGRQFDWFIINPVW